MTMKAKIMAERRQFIKGGASALTFAVSMLVVAVALSPLSAFAWGPGHNTVAKCVLEKLPSEWRARFKSEWMKQYLGASHIPDNGRTSLIKADDIEWLTANCGLSHCKPPTLAI